MGRDWDNRPRIGAWLEESAEIIRANPQYFEVGLHGLGHEFWVDSVMTRAEWHDAQGQMRPRAELEARLQMFNELVEQHRLGQKPSSMVPTAWLHNFGHPSENFAEIAQRYGITSIFTAFRTMTKSCDPETEWFGFDSGLITVNRDFDPCPWNQFSPEPKEPPFGPICSFHWPNILHADPKKNDEAVARWIEVLKPFNQSFDRMLSPNTELFLAQLVHHSVSRVEIPDGEIELDARAYFSTPWKHRVDAPVTIKVRSGGVIHSMEASVSPECPIVRIPLPR